MKCGSVASTTKGRPSPSILTSTSSLPQEWNLYKPSAIELLYVLKPASKGQEAGWKWIGKSSSDWWETLEKLLDMVRVEQ